MSNYVAIGGVSATLQRLLRDRMELPYGLPADFEVTVGRPPSEPEGDDPSEDPRVNLFLYRVTENGFLKNQEIPGHGHPGTYGRPPLSLDLHYLLTPYGTSQDGAQQSNRQAHILLGSAMRVFHDYPIITEGLRTVRSPVGDPILEASLQGEYERVKLSLDPISLEDLSKVWTALTLPYRLSAAYLVSLVQIESEQPRRYPRLVGEPPAAGPRVFAVPLRGPRLEEVHVRRHDDAQGTASPFPYARIGDTLLLSGRNLSGEALTVVLREISLPVTPGPQGRLEVVLPDAAYPDGRSIPEEQRLQPGPQTVEIVSAVPGLPQAGLHSNQAVFMLVPHVGTPAPVAGQPRLLRVPGTRLFAEALTGEALIGRAVVPKVRYQSATPTELVVPLPDVLPARAVAGLISGEPVLVSELEPTPAVTVTIGAESRVARFPSTPATLAEAAVALQEAIRGAEEAGPAFRGTRVTTMANRLVVVPAGLTAAVSVSMAPGDPKTAVRLKLTTNTGARALNAYLSGQLRPFPAITAAHPAVTVSTTSATGTVTTGVATLASPPANLADAAALLEAALHAAGFVTAHIAVLEDQLLVRCDGAASMTFDAVPNVDGTTASELQLHGRYAVRVRVNGAESIDEQYVEMPL